MLILNNLYRVIHYCVAGEQTALNVLHYEVTAKTTTGYDLDDGAAAITAIFKAPYQQLLSSQASYYGATSQRIEPPDADTMYGFKNIGVGFQTGDMLPRQTCGLISWKTDKAGRRGRGRTYIPFPPEIKNEADSRPSDGYVEDVQDLATLMKTITLSDEVGDVTLRLQIYHRDLHTWRQVAARTVKKKWATQRRRGSFGRPNPPPEVLG